MALVSGEITVQGERYLLKDFRPPQVGEHYLHDGKVFESISNFTAIDLIIVEPAPKPWRVPTDEDAKRRPKCRVGTFKTTGMLDGFTLIYVGDDPHRRYYVINAEGSVDRFTYCEIQD